MITNLKTHRVKTLRKDLTGKKLGKLLILERTDNIIRKHNNLVAYKCQCDCGNTVIKTASNLHRKTVDCGCETRSSKTFIKKDIIGIKFSKLTVLELIDNKCIGQYKCKCECGKFCIKSYKFLHRKGVKIKSCGCSLGETRHKENSGINKIYNIYKRSALSRKLLFELNKKDIEELIFKNCYYCNSSSSNTYNYRTKEKLLYNGIDRVNNNLGYTKNNCVPCCADCNRGKRIMTKKEFLNWVENIYNHSIKRYKNQIKLELNHN